MPEDRREFLKKCFIGGCTAAIGAYAVSDLFLGGVNSGLRVGFRNDAPRDLWKYSKEAEWYEVAGSGSAEQIHCRLCPHRCVLAAHDRGFCRTRAVKDHKLWTVAYGNPCTVHVDPVEKKPLFHFLPGTSIFSLSTAGCNLRCINCQNWEISQLRPEDTENMEFFPNDIVQVTRGRNIPSIAYTYAEPIVYYEYTYDTAALAREAGVKNVLVTAGFIEEEPLRKLCKVSDAANVNIKGFTDRFYRKVCQGTLKPVLRAIEVMREEGVWVEITHLTIPTLADDLDEIREMAKWIVTTLGADFPLHFSRFHPAYRVQTLPPTPLDILEKARDTALEAGLRYVYIGNVPERSKQDTVCPKCRARVIERDGYRVSAYRLHSGRCACGASIPGVWT
jgi:pyruvate formate lyase activating enzyme